LSYFVDSVIAMRNPGPILCLAAALGLLAPLGAAELAWVGRVVDENETPVSGAVVTVRPASVAVPSGGSWQAHTDPTGVFTISLPEAGDYLVGVDCAGYYALHDQPVHLSDNPPETTLAVAKVREVFQSVDVNERPSPVDVAETRNQERLTGTEVNDVPYANSHSLLNSLALMPGVVEDATGAPHFNGSSSNQVLYSLNGFNITNPISGQLQTVLAVEGVRSMDFSSGRDSAELGKGTAGTLAITTDSGTDAFHYTATDFIPGVTTQGGFRLGNWYPRAGISGPIVRGRAWFSDTIFLQYDQGFVTGLPAGQNTRDGFAGSNLLHTQVNTSPGNILFADFLVNLDNEGRYGLGALDPVSTTTTTHAREYFASLKDQVYFGHGTLVEFGYAHNYFLGTQTPQGQNLYEFSPVGRTGNYFVRSRQTASRDEGMVQGHLPAFHLAGPHRLEAGVDGDLLEYNAAFHRTGYELIGLNGQVLSTTLFQGSGVFGLHDGEMSWYLLDDWRISKRLQLNLGVRQDWERRLDGWAWSPRAAFSWSPFATARTRVSGGYAVTHDAVTMELLGLPLDQGAITTQYNASGAATGPPAQTMFARGPGPWELPRATNWTLNVDHSLTSRLHATVKYLRRRGTDGFVYENTLAPDAPPYELPLPNAQAAGLYQLTNLRRDDYNSFQVSVRQRFSGQFEWMAAYTRSHALSNAVLDYNAGEPLFVLPGQVPMPWDAPNRVVGWAYLPLPWKKWAISALADARSGFPFSVEDQTGLISGAVDSHRYPAHFDLNLAIERMVTLHGYRFALRGGIDNATNRKNPTAVNNLIGSPEYLQFFGDEGRHFVVRIRFFGKAGK
jgi:hypothetical protein